MKAFAYHGPGIKALNDHSEPVITESTDAIASIAKPTI
jgi:hypothetical protein